VVHPSTPPSSGGNSTGTNPDVGVVITTNVKWTFAHAINQDDVDLTRFTVTKASDDSVVTGTVTIDDTKKIVTFIPIDIAPSTNYTATASAVRLLDGSGSTTPINVNFTTL
jgi:hypothetical protein